MSSPLLPDDAILGGFLLLADVPEPYRDRLRPDLFLPPRRRVAEAMLTVTSRLGACLREPLEEEMARLGAGVQEIFSLRSFVPIGALPDELPDLIDALEQRARREAATQAPIPVPLSGVLDGLLEQVKAGPPKCVATPFPTLNRYLAGGFAPGELVYIGARAGIGKSALGLEIARHAAKAGERVLIASLEMMNLAVARRAVAQATRIPATRLRTGQLGDGEWWLIEQALPQLRGLPIWLTDQARSLAQIEACAGGFSPPLGLLIVDYLQLVDAPHGIESRRLEVEAISQGLKALAVRMAIPVLCISALSRGQEGDDREPTLRSLRESGKLEFDGDVILLLHRKFQATETACIVAKNRDGREGRCGLLFRAEHVGFEEASDRSEE